MSAIELNAVDVGYDGRIALRNVTLAIESGTVIGVIGPNGAGKSTLLKAVAGLLRPTRGSIKLFGASPQRAKPGTIAYVPQVEHVDWSFPASVRDVVAMGRFVRIPFYRRFSREDGERVERAMHDLGLDELRDRHIAALSGGQQQRTFLARAIAQDPQVLLLDEPTTGVDAQTEEALRIRVRKLAADGLCVLMSTHDLSRMAEWFDRVAIIENGISAFGTPQEIDAMDYRFDHTHGHGHAVIPND